jgi:hypothetical protein
MMPRFRPIRGVLFLIFTVAGPLGCSDEVSNPTGPSVSEGVSARLVTVEPRTLAPEFAPGVSCGSARPFDVSFSLLLGAPGHTPLAFRSIHFRFTDRLGVQSVPTAQLLPVPMPGQSTLPSISPVPIPTPGQSAPIVVSAGGLGRFPFRLQFGCGVLLQG